VYWVKILNSFELVPGLCSLAFEFTPDVSSLAFLSGAGDYFRGLFYWPVGGGRCENLSLLFMRLFSSVQLIKD